MSRRRMWMSAGLVLIALALLLQQRPLRLPSSGPRQPASVPWSGHGHGTLLVLADDPNDRGAGASLEWANLLRSTFGGVDLASASALLERPDSLLAGCSLVVLPRATLGVLPLSAAEILDGRVETGGLAVLTEAPDSAWARRLGLRTAAVEWQEAWPWPHPTRTPGLGGPALPPPPRALDLRWTVWRFAPHPAAHPRTLPSHRIGGRPARWRRPVGEGAWIVLAMDLGALSLRVRQGGSAQDPGGPGGPHTFDRTASAGLRGRGEPWLDAWTHALLDPEGAAAPWPRLAPLPFADDAWLVLGADRPGDAGPTSPSDPALLSYRPPPVEAGSGLLWTWPSDLAWKRDPTRRERLGVGPFRPVGRLPTLREQMGRSAPSADGPEEIGHGRSDDLLWSEDVDAAFEELEALGLRSDSSFGPPLGEAGWIFGSALPHHPVDRGGGGIFGVWELPFVATLGGDGADPSRLRPVLDWNRLGPGGPLTLRLRAGARTATVAREAAALGADAGHRVVSTAGLLEWWERRERARLHWRWEEPELIVRIEEAPTGAAGHLGILLPRRWHGRALATWSSDSPGADARTVWRFDTELLLLEVPSSSTTLRIHYPAHR